MAWVCAPFLTGVRSSCVPQIKRELDVQKQYSKILAQRTVELEEKVRELESHNSILERNISCLYVTAKKEIERKDSMLQSLREKLWQRDGVGQTTKNSR
jgi:dihydroorotate dehydrogenase